MIANLAKGKDFRGVLRYNLQKVDQGVAKILDSSFISGNEHAIMQEVALIRIQRPNLQKYFYHTSLNFPPKENLGDEQMNIIANEYLNKMGFDQHQYMIFRHFDADHPHLHALVNRIGYDGRVVSDSKDYHRSDQVVKELEKQFSLIEALSSRPAQERAMTKKEFEMMKRTGEPSEKMVLQVILKNTLDQKPTAEQFISRLEAQGITLLFKQASTGVVSGISYGYQGMQFRGAGLGNAYKWQHIKNIISYEQERDRTAIYQANVRTSLWQSKRAEQSATGGTTTGTKPETKVDSGYRKNLQQSAGKLQEQLGTANRKYGKKVTGDRHHSDQPGIANTNDRNQRRTDLQIKQSSGQQMGGPNLSNSHLIGDLLSVNNDAGNLDQDINQFKRKRKKKRGLSHRM